MKVGESNSAEYFFHRPLWRHWLEGISNLYKIKPNQIDEKFLMSVAIQNTGMSDWGEGDIQEPLSVLLNSCKKQNKLNNVGWFMLHQEIINSLSNRLLIHEELKNVPLIKKEEIRRPLFIVSLPRTGTTLLQRLLALDSANRGLIFWQSLKPVPPPNSDDVESDSRIGEAANILKLRNELAPGFSEIHETRVNEPEECLHLFHNSLTFPSLHMIFDIPEYEQWLQTQDMTFQYAYYHRQLQILQSKLSNKRWVLKSPWHLYYMDALLLEFPDACIVQTHRDPKKIMPSVCSLAAMVQGMNRDELDLKKIGLQWTQEWAAALENSSKVRKKQKAETFFDIHYQDLVQDPIKTIKDMYKYFEYDFETEFEEKMKEWLVNDSKTRKKQNKHQYSLEQFGLNEKIVSNYFDEYCKEFNITSE